MIVFIVSPTNHSNKISHEWWYWTFHDDIITQNDIFIYRLSIVVLGDGWKQTPTQEISESNMKTVLMLTYSVERLLQSSIEAAWMQTEDPFLLGGFVGQDVSPQLFVSQSEPRTVKNSYFCGQKIECKLTDSNFSTRIAKIQCSIGVLKIIISVRRLSFMSIAGL